MTHDELLVKLNGIKPLNSPAWNMQNALRAVVETIQGYERLTDTVANEEFDQGMRAVCRVIIQAIEKELK